LRFNMIRAYYTPRSRCGSSNELGNNSRAHAENNSDQKRRLTPTPIASVHFTVLLLTGSMLEIPNPRAVSMDGQILPNLVHIPYRFTLCNLQMRLSNSINGEIKRHVQHSVDSLLRV